MPPRLAPAFLAALLALAAPAAAQPADAPALPAITVAEVETALVRDRVLGSGLVEPVESVLVQPQVEGLAIDALEAEVGDTVEAGEVLARLSDASLALERSQLLASRASAEAAVAQAEAQLVEAEATAAEAVRVRDRARQLRRQGAASQAAADEAEAAAATATARVAVARQGLAAARAQVAVSQAQIADVDLRLRRTRVEAPVAGQVVARNAQLGAIASAGGEPLFEIVRDGLLELRAEVAEGDVLRLAPGQPVTIRAVGLAEPLRGEVRLVEPLVDPATRLGRARIAIEHPERVRPGLFADAEIRVSEREAPTVPLSAVAEGEGAPTALVVDAEGRVAAREVRLGVRDGERVEILEGLAPGERVVARAGAFVRPGDRVNPVLAEAAPSAGPAPVSQ